MKAADIMTSPAVTIGVDDPLEQAARAMLDHKVGGLPVVDAEGHVVGFVTDSDFSAKKRGIPFGFMTAPQVLGEWLGNEGVERIFAAARDRKVREVMSAPPIVATEDATIEAIIRRMLERDVNRIVIVRGESPVGIVARHDLLTLMSRKGAP